MVYVSQVGGAVPARILMCQSKIGSASKLMKNNILLFDITTTSTHCTVASHSMKATVDTALCSCDESTSMH